MTPKEINQAAFNEVGPKGTAEQYADAVNRIAAGNPPMEEPRCAVTGLTAEEKLEKADAYAKKHGVDLVAALKALGYAK